MRVTVTLTGADDLKRKVDALPNAVSRRVQLAALRKGAEPIRSFAESIAPRDEDAGAPHMADHIIIAPLSARARDFEGLHPDAVAVEVGPERRFFYAFFQEIGTAFHAAQAFMRPAFDSQVNRAHTIIRSEVWASIRKHLRLGGGPSATGRGV